MPLKVFIVNGNKLYDNMFENEGFTLVDCVEHADVVCFTGGEDVSPALYGELRHPHTHTNMGRDMQEVGIYQECIHSNTPMVGICRGGQFLNVMSGGGLYQHVDGHANGLDHEIVTQKGDIVEVTSTHHQMMKMGEAGVLLAYAHNVSTIRNNFVNGVFVGEQGEHQDVEVVYYPNTNALCFQPHPEFNGVPDCTNYFFNTLESVIGKP